MGAGGKALARCLVQVSADKRKKGGRTFRASPRVPRQCAGAEWCEPHARKGGNWVRPPCTRGERVGERAGTNEGIGRATQQPRGGRVSRNRLHRSHTAFARKVQMWGGRQQ